MEPTPAVPPSRSRLQALWNRLLPLRNKLRWFTWRRSLLIGGVFVALVATLVAWAAAPYWRAAGQFDDSPLRQPSRLYGQPRVLQRGQPLDTKALIESLREMGYRALQPGEPFGPGRYVRDARGALTIYLRTFPTREGRGGGVPVTIRTDGARVTSLAQGEHQLNTAALEPPVIASYYGEDFKERRPVKVEELPKHVVTAVLAAEDSRFFSHAGVSIIGTLRAVWVNVQGGEIRQGGSTLTQQLAKNLYLSNERSLSRKLREAVLAVILELRYSKRDILQAYLNEIYLGGSHGVNLIGIGSASRACFGKDAQFLTLAEAATLAGMIPSPANYSPLSHPDKALSRRNLVLDRMVEVGWLDAPTAEKTKAEPIRLAPEPVVRRRAPYFASAAAAEAISRFAVTDLDDAGYVLLSTLDWRDQQAAEEAVGWGLKRLEAGWGKGRDADTPLQAALVSISPEDGGIRAYVGGRDFGASQFDRAGQARRQAGSAFKPVVYATAFEMRQATPATLLNDEPLTIRLYNQTWEPKNDDDEYRGWVTARTALEDSLNVPTARLALQTGLARGIEVARGMGVGAPLEEVPALALGAFEVSPVEMASIYGTLAAGGARPSVHTLDGIFDRTGQPVPGAALAKPQRVLSAPATYLVTSVLQGVFDRGTGASAREMGLGDRLAGKSGTTNARRDNWFAGYAPRRATVVWVGYDDNIATRMSGSRAALPIWTRFMVKVRPPGGYPDFRVPDGITTATIDPASGELATEECPDRFTEVFLVGQVPDLTCHLHGSWWESPRGPEPVLGTGEEPASGFRRFWRRLFGRDQQKPPEPPQPPPPPR